MRVPLLLIASVSLAGTAAAPLHGQRIERRFAVDSDVAIRVYNLVGVTRITAWDRDTVAVWADIPAGGGTFFGGGQGRVAKLGVDRQDDRLTERGATLDVRVPRDARVWVKSASARIEVSGLTGELEVSSVTGAVELDGSPRVVQIQSIDGDVVVRGAPQVMRLNTGSGRITARGGAQDLTATAVQGNIRIEDAVIANGRVENVSGAVWVSGRVEPNGLLDLQTHSGPIDLRLASPLDADLELTALLGSITTQLGDGAPGRSKERVARLRVGAGGARITARSFRGDVTVVVNPGPRRGVKEQ